MPSDAHRLLMKASYQRNMLRAQACVVATIGAAILVYALALSADPETVSIALQHRTTLADLYAASPHAAAVMIRPAARTVPRMAQRPGFLGFTRLDPVNPATQSVAAILPSPLYDLKADEPLLPDLPTSFSPEDGESFAMILPSDADFIRSPHDGAGPAGVNRGVQWIRKVKPEVPLDLDLLGRKAYVEVLLLIDERGNHTAYSVRPMDSVDTSPECMLGRTWENGSSAAVKFYIDSRRNDLRYVTISEEPQGYGYADWVAEVLPANVFSPAIRNGAPVASFVRLGFRFTDRAECLTMELRSEQQASAVPMPGLRK